MADGHAAPVVAAEYRLPRRTRFLEGTRLPDDKAELHSTSN